MRRHPLLSSALALLLLLPATLAAQKGGVRRGFWLGGGIGEGSAKIACNICVDERKSGITAYARMGFTATSTLRVGIEGSAWQHKEDDVQRRMLALAGTVYLYPSPRSGFYVKAGLGLAKYRIRDDNQNPTQTLTVQAFSGQLGLGYEFRVLKDVAIGPWANLVASTGGSVRIDNTVTTVSSHLSLVQVGIGVTWH